MSLIAGGSHGEQKGGQSPFNRRWIGAFWARRRRRMAATAVLVLLVSFVLLIVQTPKYTATALMLIHPGVGLDRGREVDPPTVYLDSQLDILRSPMMMARLVESLGLNNDPEWNPHLSSDRADHAHFVGAAASAVARRGPKDRVQESVLKRVSAAINVRRRPTSAVVEVSATSAKPERAAQMANRLVHLFVAHQLEQRSRQADAVSSRLAGRLQELRNFAEQKQGALERYRATNQSPTQQTCDLIAQQVATARADLAKKKARYEQLRRAIENGLLDGIGSERLAQLRAREADIRRRQADVESRYGEQHPVLESLREERRDIEAQIAAELRREVARLRNEVEVARAQLAALQHALADCRDERQNEGAGLRELEREAKVAGDVLDTFRQQYLQLVDGGSLPRIGMAPVMMSAAGAPASPSSPNLTLALLVSIGLGLASGLAVGLFAEIS